MKSRIKVTYAYIVCFFCVVAGGVFSSMATYNVVEIYFTESLHPEIETVNQNHLAQIKHYEEFQLEQKNLRENWKNSEENTGVAPSPYLSRHADYPTGYGTAEYISKQALAKFYSSMAKVVFAIIIFFAHWHIAKREPDIDLP